MVIAEKINVCIGCIWNDSCGFIGPCGHYTPANCEDILEERDIDNERERYDAEWQEYIDYCAEAYN